MFKKIISFIAISLLVQAAQNSRDLELELDRVIPVKDVRRIIWGYLNCWSETHALPNDLVGPNAKAHVLFSHDGNSLKSYRCYRHPVLSRIDLKTKPQVVFSADGNYINSYTHPELTVFNLKKQPKDQIVYDLRRSEMPSHAHEIVSSFSPDGKYLVVVSKQNFVVICDTATGRQRTTLIDISTQISSILWSPGSSHCALVCTNESMHISAIEFCDAKKWTFLHHASVHPVQRFLFLSDNQYTTVLHSQHDNLLHMSFWDWTVSKWEPCRLKMAGKIESAACSSDGKFIALASNKEVKIWRERKQYWDYELFQELLDGPMGTEDRSIKFINWSPDNKYLGIRTNSERDKTLYLWDREKKKVVDQIPDVLFFVFSPDGTQIATVASDKTIKIWSNPVVTQEILNKNKSKQSTCVIS